jgi:Tol biopolymer transport system component
MRVADERDRAAIRGPFPAPMARSCSRGPTARATSTSTSIEPDGTELQRLTTGPQAEFSPASSPDGGRIAFTKDTGETCGHLFYGQGDETYVAHADGSAATRLTNNCPTADYMPSWSPSGARLVFVRKRSPLERWVMEG